MKYGLADYGLNVWFGAMYDYEERLRKVKELGFDGLERLYATSAEEAVTRGAFLKKNGLSFATVHAGDVEKSIKWTSALGGEYVWVNVMGQNGIGSPVPGYTFDDYCRHIDEMSKVCASYGIDVVLHNHMGSKAETQEEVDEIMSRCKDLKLLFDVGHMALAGGDVRYIVEKYFDRIAAYHFKGRKINEKTPDHPDWDKCGRFCGLAQGDFFVDNEYVFKYAVKHGFDGWMFVEQDSHVNDPWIDLKENLEILKKWREEA